MNKDIFPVIGYTYDRQYTIYGDQYSFVLTDVCEVSRRGKNVKQTDGFIYGFTYGGHDIAIYCGTQVSSYGYARINTYLFVRAGKKLFSENNTVYYSEIEFTGGTLNQLFRPRAVKSKETENGISITYAEDRLSYDFDFDGDKGKIKVSSAVSWSMGINGTLVDNTQVQLSIEFEEPKPMSHLVKCYQTLLVCMRFMTNRHQVGVDGIRFFTSEKDDAGYPHVCDAFVSKEENCTKKELIQCITFEDLGDTIVNLWGMVYTSNESIRHYSLGFFPENDIVFSQGRVTNSMIRSLCSALEFEADQESLVQPDNNKQLSELMAGVKNYVSEFRKTHKGEGELSDSTYSRIFGGIDFWSFSAREKIQKLYDIHERAMSVFNKRLLGSNVIDIPSFVRYRNNITHGAENQPSLRVATTAIALRSLVYCCILKRIGKTEEDIVELANWKINS